MDIDLNERLFKFAVNVLKFLKSKFLNDETRVIKYQLSKSATSSGANYEEAQAASSTADFKYKLEIALREMRESNYWLRIVQSIEETEDENLKYLLDESEQLKKILGSIVAKLKNKSN